MDIKDSLDFWVDCIDDISDHIDSSYRQELKNHITNLIDVVRGQSSPVYHNICNNVQQ